MAVDDLKNIQPPEDLEKQLKDQAGLGEDPPSLPEGTSIDPVLQDVNEDELVTKPDDLKDVNLSAREASTDNLQIKSPTKPTVPEAKASTVSDKVGRLDAAKLDGPSEGSIISDVPQGEISEGAYADVVQGEVSKESTVQYQLGELMDSIQDGQPLPAWAAGAARGATAVMQQRGLGASSMASAAMVQAIMESGIPIASADARTYAQMDLANLSAKQQTTLANAAMVAGMDRANLDARMTAAVNNAKAFLTIDLQNLDNEQKARTLSYQAELEAMFKDQAAENAMEQFNAKNQMQVEQFFAELDVQVQNSNANRTAAMEQFNVSESNAMSQFSASLNDTRQRFNQQLQVQIDQSNAVWRRDVNTANTAIQNETNRINAQNLLSMTQAAQNALWQKYRDEASWIFQMSENAQQRAHQVGMLAMENKYNMSLYDTQFERESLLAIGDTALRIIFGGIDD